MVRQYLCVHLPALPLQAYAHIGPAGPSHAFAEAAPLVVIEREAQRTRIVARNRLAARAGIAPGHTLAQAHALAEPLAVLPRDLLREQALLERLAATLATFTPHVHIHAARASLIAEVAASLRLFGGIDALCNTVTQAVEPIAARHHLIAAASATAADWLARAHRRLVAHPPIADWLHALPITTTDWPPALIDELGQLNLSTVGEVDRLPRAELTRRFGPALIDSLDRAHARRDEVFAWWQPPTVFHARIELLDPAREARDWQPGVEALLADLERFLRERALGTPTIEFAFHAGREQHTHLPLAAASPTVAAADWLRLFHAALERQPLGHEVAWIELHSERLEPLRFEAIDLFDLARRQDKPWRDLLALLRLRLGAAHIRPPRRQTTPMPESDDATRHAEIEAPAGVRPLFLIDPPRRLTESEWKAEWPKLRRTIERTQPERIRAHGPPSAGFEAAPATPDGAIERDYYIARLPDQRTLWLFRDRRDAAWFVQGVFA